jgi:hypothetical protein
MGWDGPTTHRQFLVWEEWLFQEMNRPGRLEHYLMRVALEIRRFLGLFVKDPGPLTLDAFRVPFERRAAAAPAPAGAAEKMKRSQSIWAALTGAGRQGKGK